jgi:O-antigen/teichoic acid export membrane protein
MSTASVTKNTTYLTLSYIGQKILAFFYFVMVARMIGVEDLGKYTFALSFATLFSVFVDFGLTQALIREIAKFKDKTKSYLAPVLTVKLALAALIYAMVVVVVNLMNYPEITKQLVYISGVIMVLDQFTVSFWGVFRGHQNLKYEAISVVINQVLILGVGLTVLFLHLPLIYLMLPFLAGSSFSLLFSIFSVRWKLKVKFGFDWDTKVLKFLFKISIPFALIAIFSKVYGYVDTVMLSKMVGDAAVGWYSVAMKIPFALQFIPAALAAAIYPAFSYNYVHNKEQLTYTFDRVMKFLVVIVLPISFGIAILARPIIQSFYGAEYLPSTLPLQVLMLGLLFVFLNFPLGSLMNSCDKQVTNTELVGVTMVINIILNIILIPKYSFVGSAVAFLISHSLLFLAGLVIAKRIIPYKKRSLLWIGLRSLVSVGVMAGVLYLLLDYLYFAWLIIIGAVIYFAMMFLVRGLTRVDIEYFYKVLIKRQNI